jgi:predicted CoA-substrate-specific enzyme activase
VRAQLNELFHTVSPARLRLSAATGSAGRFFAELVAIPFINEVAAQAAAIAHLYPNLSQASVIEMGGQDSKLIFLVSDNTRLRVRDFSLNTVCAAGTGSFLDQQADRLGVSIEREFGQLALQSASVPRMAGRCSVFAKSDMIHLQQQATPICDILAGLCLALARNLKSNLGCGRQFKKPIIFTGGVAANVGVVRALGNVFELEPDELLIPQQHFFTGAIGAALITRARAAQAGDGHPLQLELLDRYLADKRAALQSAPRRQPLTTPTLPPPASPLFEHLLDQAERPIDVYLGVDVGSLSTNVVVMDRQRRILAKAYLMTAGRPLEAVKQGLDLVGRKVQGKVKILGAATTGSGRYLTGDFIGADIVINEITAQAAGAAIINPDVDTIFEIGGQDSKYISLENGVVVDFEMNHACAAGTGSFLEEQAQRLGIKIDKEFAALAFKSDHPIKLGERCTVFMESDLLSYQQQGAKVEDLVAGLSYSIVANYLNRVVGRRKIGKNICFQGGTAFNHAVWAAFEKVLAKPIMVPDHHEVTGALGAASIAAEHMDKLEAQTGRLPASTFRGFSNLISVEYTVESFTCEHCANHCEVKKVQLPGAPPLYYGSRCDRYNLSKKQRKAETFDAFDFRNHLLLECAGLDERALAGPAEPSKKPTIGIPLALVYWQLLPLFAQFFRALGFGVVLSGKTDQRIIRMGIESVTAQPCFPVKVAFGHVVQLMASNVDYIFWPSIVSMTNQFQENQHNQLCPYVQSFGYLTQSAFGDHNGRPNRPELLTMPVRLGEGNRLLRKSFAAIAKRLGVPQTKLHRALKQGLAAQHKFDQAMKEKGRELLAHLGPDDKLFVLVSRPYNGCDDGINLRLPHKLADLGAKTIPMEMLDLNQAQLTEPGLHRQVYWSYGQKILRAAEITRKDPRLFAIYLSNFSCGPDSFLLTFFKDIMGDKPCLQLEIDEHSADAGVITRLEAFLESLRNYRPQPQTRPQRPPKSTHPQAVGPRRTLYIPYMGDSTYGVAACLTGYGQPAEAMPLADEAALLKGREFTSGKECLPCAITAGDMLKLLSTDGFDPDRAAFFMPSAQGPCRFGMYNCLHQLILKYAGMPDVPVLAPNQDSSFYDELTTIFDGAGQAGFMRDLWTAIVGIDLLHKVVLRIRPFAKDPRHAQQLYEKLRTQWVQAVERRQPLSELIQLMAAFTDYLAAVDIDRLQPKPRIGIVGEIYVRSHPFANRNLVARLEQLGATCDLAPLAEWIYYTNLTRGRMARRRRQLRNFVTNTLQNYFQHKIEKALAKPLERKFGKLAEQPVQDVLHLARPYLHDSFEGEAVLSIGKTVEYHHQGFGGVINVMPFSCMPSTIVSAQTRRVSADCDDMPILNISFDGQEDPTLTTRLEAFVDQVRQRQYGNVTAVQVMAAGK